MESMMARLRSLMVMLVVALHHLACGGHERHLPDTYRSYSNDALTGDLWLSTAELSSA